MKTLDDIPSEFKCPISHDVMEFPYITTAGNSYEYSEIKRWLKDNNTDPLSNVVLQNKSIVPNNSLRSQILSWFEQNPKANHLRNDSETKPPEYDGSWLPEKGLDQLLLYRGKEEVQKMAGPQKGTIPADFSAFGNKYTFTKGGDNGKKLKIRCNGGDWVDALEPFVFATRQGLIFNSQEMRETRILPGTDNAELCKFSNICNKENCPFAHPFVCIEGVLCKKNNNGKCKFFHPELSSVVPVEKAEFQRVCRYGTSCSVNSCKFAHPKGKMEIKRVMTKLFITHSLSLEKLKLPIALSVQIPEQATQFQFQGEFIFFFEPYAGPWAKQHFKTVIVHRFDAKSETYKEVGHYSLDKHYCNCVVGRGKYIVISFWPYEEEAMRTIWDGIRVCRKMDQEMKTLRKENKALKEELKSKDEIIAQKDAEISRLKQAINNRTAQISRMINAKKEAKDRAAKAAAQRAEEAAWRRLQLNQERQRNERLRYRDPIHIYVQKPGVSGFTKDDWTLVVDFHKGAHDIQLEAPDIKGVQRLKITENNNIFNFDLVVPDNLKSIGVSLPIVPARLCPEF